ncbi:RDD family protein [Kitasatospora sp. NPDC091207]|uniref:RDD family protein n=1 Tax=Kitasatospora sp. NPDC091207 TaxID=3364083 RepID=UPI0037FA6C9A
MTDRPFAGGAETAVGPTPGYYPDPSVPGFVRYWGGTAWVPGTSRPAPAAGEVLAPPRFVSRRGGVAGGAGSGPGAGARFVPPPAAMAQADLPSAVVPSVAGPSVAGPSTAAPSAVEVSGETGPVYLDQTAGGASFSVGPHLAAGPAAAQVGSRAGGSAAGDTAVGDSRVGPAGGGPTGREGGGGVPDERDGEPGASGWQVDPRAQRGLMETGGAPRWVSWGVLPGAEPPPGTAGTADVRPVGGERAPGARVEPAVVVEPVVAHSVVVESAAAAGPVAERASGPAVVAVAAPVRAAAPAPVVASVAAQVAAPERELVPESSAAEVPAVIPAPAAPAVQAGGARRTAARRRPPAPVAAGPGRRLAARLVDTAVLAVVATAAAIPLGGSVRSHLQQKLDQARMASALTRRQVDVWLVDGVVVGKVAVLIALLAFVGVLYEVLPTARTGQTFGKRLARIRVVDAAPSAARPRLSLARSLTRWLVRNASAVLLLGLVWPLFDRPARRGWHDRMAGTRVVRD